MRVDRVMLWASAALAACQFSDPKDVAIDASPFVCAPSSATCSGTTLTSCAADGLSSTDSTCGFGCATSGDRCADLAPSNGLGPQLDAAATAEPLVLTGNATIDTTAGSITNGDGTARVVHSEILTGGPVEIFAISVKSLAVDNVTVTGTRALAILSDGDVTIAGVLSVSAEHGRQGPGSIELATDSCVGGRPLNSGNNHSGAGGGGFGGQGGWGGYAPSLGGGAPGGTVGDPMLVPLRGGCRGGDGGVLSSHGAGGGAVQVSTRGTITVLGGAAIAANGGGGHGGGDPLRLCFLGLSCAAGAGGGAGGAILLEAHTLTVAATGAIVANGGSGHFGTPTETFASNGLLTESASPPFACTDCPPGGSGGAEAHPAETGGGTANPGEGAGGGGGVGRVRINLPQQSPFDPGPPILSPLPTVGSTTLR